MAASEYDIEPLMYAECKKERSAEIIQQINSKNAKLVACALVFSFILYHGTVHLRYGSDSCKWLLSEGRYKGDMEWQPYGCMMHRYSQTDTRRCMRYLAFYGHQNRFVFIGDARIHDLYTSFLDHLTGHESKTGGTSFKPNLTFVDSQLRLTVEYIWSPDVGETMISNFNKWKKEKSPPVVIVAGCGTWILQNTNHTLSTVHNYAFNITKLVQIIEEEPNKKSKLLWVLQEPVDESKLAAAQYPIKNSLIDQLNRAAVEVLRYSSAEIWASSRLMVEDNMDDLIGGLYLGSSCLRHDTQLLLNAYCNDYMNFNDGTCCSSAEPYTTLQVLTFAVFGICCILGFVAAIRRYQLRRTKEPPSSAYTLITSLAKLGVILAYFYLCDRTNFFMKENKYYSPVSFWLPIGYVFALGLFFTEDSRYTKVLHREQTDEWKGWMQLVLLIYHMTGASGNLQIYNHIQMLVSAYLFLTGYGHFYYLWHRNDVGIVRFFQVMFRLNLLAVCLCLCMNRPYQFYTFTPLVSFWVMLIYLVLTAPPRVTASSSDSNPLHYLYLILKMVTLFSLIIMLYMSEVFFEKVFVTRPWKALFVTTDDDIHQWWNRWKLDRYSMSYGVIFGMGLVVTQKFNLVDDNNHSNLFSPRPAICAVLLALVGIGSSSAFALLCHNKLECNEVHSYTVFLPIISYAILRNISGMLRTRYSSFFAWFGRISLELFLCQHHIWLAADTHGVLVLLPGYPVLNVLITSFIFVCAAHEIHHLTLVLMPFAVPSDWRLVLRNVLIFFMILVPIGIHDGMF